MLCVHLSSSRLQPVRGKVRAQALSEGGKEVWWGSSLYSLSHTPNPMHRLHSAQELERGPSPRPKSTPHPKKGPAIPQPSCLDNRS